MEALLVYGLVLLFFILLAIFTRTVLTVHPYTEPASAAAGATSKTVRKTGNALAYIVLAALFLLFCVITALDKRGGVSPAARNGGMKQ